MLKREFANGKDGTRACVRACVQAGVRVGRAAAAVTPPYIPDDLAIMPHSRHASNGMLLFRSDQGRTPPRPVLDPAFSSGLSRACPARARPGERQIWQICACFLAGSRAASKHGPGTLAQSGPALLGRRWRGPAPLGTDSERGSRVCLWRASVQSRLGRGLHKPKGVLVRFMRSRQAYAGAPGATGATSMPAVDGESERRDPSPNAGWPHRA